MNTTPTKYNWVNAVLAFLAVLITSVLSTPELVKMIQAQEWGASAIVIAGFLAGLLTKFYKHDTPKDEPTDTPED